MEDLVNRLKRLVPDEDVLERSELAKAYATGVKDAIKTVHSCVADNLYINGIYYVVMYAKGDTALPYVQRMRMFKVNRTPKNTTYLFTNQLNTTDIQKADLVLTSKDSITDRVFSSEEQAENAIRF